MRESFPELAGATFPDLGGVIFLRRVDSTNRLARHILDEYTREEMGLGDVLLIALEQRKGKGRQGRVWDSPAGQGLYATLLVSEIRDVSLLPLLVPLALCRALNRYLEGRCAIKWPNDLTVGGAKLGGVLLEVVHRGGQASAAIVGFGVNLGMGTEMVSGATSLSREMGQEGPPLGPLASDLVAAVRGSLSAQEDRKQVVEEYRELLAHREGDPMRCRIGEELFSGSFAGIDDDGRLALEVRGSIRFVSAGEIFP